MKKRIIALFFVSCLIFCGACGRHEASYSFPEQPQNEIVRVNAVDKPDEMKLFSKGKEIPLTQTQLDDLWTELNELFNLPSSSGILQADDIVTQENLIELKKSETCLELIYESWQTSDNSFDRYYGILLHLKENAVGYNYYRENVSSTFVIETGSFDAFDKRYAALREKIENIK